jgi:aminopeptidase N
MGSGDMYPKGGNMLHTIRHSIHNDQLFRNILAGLNQTFYHQTVDGSQIQEYISKKAGYDYNKVFKQYLTTTQIPELDLYINAKNDEVFYKWTNCIDGFNLPLSLTNSKESLRILPAQKWQSIKVTHAQLDLFNAVSIEKMYYIKVKELQRMND